MTPFLLKFLMVIRRWPTASPSTSLQIDSSHARSQISARESIPQSSGGFSLLEIIVIVIIVGILAAIAAPSWLSLANRQRVRTTQDEILQAIRTTQSTAKQRRRPQEIEFVADGTGDIPTLRISGNLTELGSGNLKPDMVNMTVTDSTDAAVTTLEFLQDGTISTDADLPVKILLTSSGIKRCLFVETLLGGVRAESDGDCS
ncbi:Tfp pilus assembly protein FimT/FimU [Okeania sp. SIO2G5]|uniref:pilus assembly FimT family protein n=1 Tax=Okeania sp. SIO2G5 TaxID=2607796 RepID=UPI0013C0A468|nr:prepilin-type N-terminal cleavage/methylation domain-containing protein [Okeania sp. SIO2G5]NEP76624.1 hypothetical protein [Okeania sp. SIO2G5]